MRNTLKKRVTGMTGGLLALALTAAACGGNGETNTGASGAEGDSESKSSCDEVTLGIIPSWTDGLSTAYLWKDVLGDEGYDVKIKELSEAAPLYTGLANGDVDVYPSGWPEVTHASYMDQYGDKIEDLGTYYDNAKLTFAVPEYTDVESISDLKGNAKMFDGRIVGIEPGAGLTRVTKESVIPEYNLGEDYKLVESSTTAMLAELKDAVSNEEDIVVTLWRPFWANSEFPLKDLKDPKGALGEPEGLHALGTAGFSEECSDVAEMFSNFKLTDEQYGSLENMVVNEYGQGKEAEAVAAWLKQNPDFVESLKG
jgi:glycine betaine/proline transport system substrate-binding protein